MNLSSENGYEMAYDVNRSYQRENRSGFYSQNHMEDTPTDSAPRDRNSDSCRLSVHTAVQIPEITSFRLTEVDVPPRRSSMHEFANQPISNNKQGFSTAHKMGRRTRGSCDSPLPVALKFEEISFRIEIKVPQRWIPGPAFVSVKHKQTKYRQILNEVTGMVTPCEMLAIMGPSGSGKTSFIKILAGRMKTGVSGRVSYNDLSYTSALKRRIGFVTQDDLLFPQLTVKETLIFAAQLRLPRSMTSEQKVERAEIVIKDLGLERCQHNRVGGIFIPGVSGGERKRASIGHELLVNPSLLFLDEPTSGLDSTTALRLLHVLHKNAKVGRTIIMTIHQPSSRLFYMFDKLLLLSEGHPIYFGKGKDAMNYFASLGFSPQLAMNPADFLLDLATGNADGITLPDSLKHLELCMQSSHNPSLLEKDEQHSASDISVDSQQLEYQFSKEVLKILRSSYKTQIEPGEKRAMEAIGKTPEHLQAVIQLRRDWTSSWLTQFFVISNRMFRERVRDYFEVLRFSQAVGVAILLGLLWWQAKIETEAQLRDQVGLIFYICIFWSTSSIFASVYSFPLEQHLLAKERAADMYRLSVYHISSTFCDVPSQILYPTIFMLIVYFMAGFEKTAVAFIMTMLAVYLIVLTGQGVGEFFGAAILNIKKAGTIVSIVLLIFLLTGGYYVQHIPGFIKWLKYISFVYYGFRLLLKVQFSPSQTYECSETTGCKSLQLSPSFAGIIDLDGGAEEAWILITMAIGYRLLAYMFLRRIKIGT
ncbi:hypothetical protein KP509_13G057300 [Ceratopteris richardii]|nr:hypothetical protein KP509_13G057300 [Ceratopteris richardii]KAH7421440.1 hypothetical protein KP509_13G057300 [Ceratopteris richardii]KAH7421441.1 hypothetical protein KP509_13G057300 [Ceratopteris richardii]KAH7421442.1 hypothetical protein KP509_13G057300 [Ceratopteris richardii]